jgi:Flp pilus assembly pilin Flp
MSKFLAFLRSKKGAAMVEYALLVAGIAIVAVAAVSVLGHKTSDLIGTSAAIIPGVSSDDNNPMSSGRIIETDTNASGNITLDVQQIVTNSNTERLGDNMGYDTGELPTLVVPYP